MAVPDGAVRLGLGAGVAGFALVGAVALAAGVSLETAALRAVVGSGVLGALALAGGAILRADRPAQPRRARSSLSRPRGRLVDVALPEEGGWQRAGRPYG
jgi:hypothetical protein